MDPQISTDWISQALILLLSWVVLPLGLLLWQLFDNTKENPLHKKELAQTSGCSCLTQFCAFVISMIIVGSELQAVGGAIYTLLCSIASYFIMQAIVKIPEPQARSSAIWIAIVSLPAQIYAFGWAIGH